MTLTLHELEQAINYWRHHHPSTGEEQKLCAQANALATPYAQMIMSHSQQVEIESLSKAARDALVDWRLSQAAPARP